MKPVNQISRRFCLFLLSENLFWSASLDVPSILLHEDHKALAQLLHNIRQEVQRKINLLHCYHIRPKVSKVGFV
jgi:hypothetical protein